MSFACSGLRVVWRGRFVPDIHDRAQDCAGRDARRVPVHCRGVICHPDEGPGQPLGARAEGRLRLRGIRNSQETQQANKKGQVAFVWHDEILFFDYTKYRRRVAKPTQVHPIQRFGKPIKETNAGQLSYLSAKEV
jgi:hypothetical protein